MFDKSFDNMLESIIGHGPNRSKLFSKTHTRKDGKPVTKNAESKTVSLYLYNCKFLMIFFFFGHIMMLKD
jgi:hypothetical protein